MAVTYFYTSELQVKINDLWIPVNTPSENLASYVQGLYVIKVFKNDSGTITQLTASAGTGNAHVTATRNTSAVDWVNSPQVTTVNYTEGSLGLVKFVVNFKANTAPATFKPSFAVTRETSPSDQTPVAVPLDFTAAQTAAGVTAVQSVNYSTATVTIPPIPDAAVAFVGSKTSSQAKYDAQTKQWVAVKQTKGSDGKYTTVTKYFTTDGKKASPDIKNVDAKQKGTGYRKAEAALLTAINHTYTKKKEVVADPFVAPNDSQTFNPPNHFFTRRPSFAEVARATGNANIAGQVGGRYALGKMIQDADSAKLLNTKLAAINSTTATKVNAWGFQFNYNPTSISYSTSSNTPIDYTLGTADSANILGGPMTISFDLYLNRIADLAELNSGYKPNNYPRPLTENEKVGLKTRGTEYDIEYLYRITNGNPVETNLTLTKQITADFGYITGVPFWLFLNDNLRYYVSLSNMSVNHVMFTTEMVPIFTVVSLTFTRYPVFDKTGYFGKAQADSFQKSQAGKTTTTRTGK